MQLVEPLAPAVPEPSRVGLSCTVLRNPSIGAANTQPLAIRPSILVRDQTLGAGAHTLSCRVRLIALDGFTFGVKLGSVNHWLKLSDVTTRFGTAAPEASQAPLDLRLCRIKVRQGSLHASSTERAFTGV